MKTSESIQNLAAAMAKAQANIGGAVKDAKNDYFDSSYADLASVVKAVKEQFSENGLAYVQLPIAHDDRIGIITRLMHESGEWLEQDFTIPYQKIDPQKAGSVLTYFRRYSLAAVAGVPQVDDDAEMAMARNEPKVTQEDAAALTGLIMDGDPWPYAAFKDKFTDEQWTALYHFPAEQKGRWQKSIDAMDKELVAATDNLEAGIISALMSGDPVQIDESLDMTPRQKKAVWPRLSEADQLAIKQHKDSQKVAA